MGIPKLLRALKLIPVAAFLLAAAPQASGFSDSFGEDGEIQESAIMAKSADPHWWLNSGGYIYRSGGKAMSVQGELPNNDHWRLLYSVTNSEDTDNGHHPQNILRLVSRAKLKNFTQQVFFNITKANLSKSHNRNESNGVLFFHRYQNGNNLYYAGIRVDGYAVVKKKFHGQYHTLKSVGVYPGVYNRKSNPNLLPLNQWIGLRTVIDDTPNGDVKIQLYLNDPQLGSGWTKILEVEDTGSCSERLMEAGFAGIRTDFLDIQFDDYEATENTD